MKHKPFTSLQLLQFPLIQHQLFSNETPARNPECSCPFSHENSQTSPHNFCNKITALAKSPSTHPLQNNISVSVFYLCTYLQLTDGLQTFRLMCVHVE